MARRLSLPEVDLSCPICCDIFKDPVVLKCSHSFCAACLDQYWGHCRGRDCPLCRKRCSDDPVLSLTLRNLCESYMGESEGVGETAGELYCDPGELCPLHGEKLKLFCLTDCEPICVVCHTSRRHKQHDCCPSSEAVTDVKDKLKSALNSLQKKKEAFDKMKKNYEDTVEHIRMQYFHRAPLGSTVQARFVERRTREEFDKLRAFLRAEEESRMEALKREEEQRSGEMMRKIDEISGDIASVSETIGVLEEEIALEGITVLHKCKRTLARANCPIEDPVMAPGALIDVSKYMGSLTFHVWEKMLQIVKYTPVTLDTNTAAPWLVLSDDLASVRDSDERQRLPDNPERYDPDTGVLGREGFAAGKHAWDVSVGDNTAWVVGVAKASVKRKEKVSSVLKNGYLCVYFYHTMYFAGTSPLTRLSLKRNPQKIRVQLDCDKGRVSFHDPDDNTHIYTFKQGLTERVFPYFWVGCQRCPLTIQPLEVSVKAVENC